MLSVIINTKDRLVDLRSCLKSIQAQRHLPQEVIIVDASLNEHLIKSMSQKALSGSGMLLKYVHTKAGNSYQRNVGISMLDVGAQYVCFLDDDVILFEDTIEKIIQKFKQYPQIVAVQGIETNRKPQHAIGKLIRKFFCIGHEGKYWRLLPSGENVSVIAPDKDIYVGSLMIGISCLKRNVLTEFTFDEWFQGYAFLEDFDFSYRIGQRYKMLQSPEIKFIHNRSITGRIGTDKMYEMYVRNKIYIFQKDMKQTFLNKLALIWSLLGHLVLNFGKSLYKRNWGFFRGTWRAVLWRYEL